MVDITYEDLLRLWRDQTNPDRATSTTTINMFFNFIQKKQPRDLAFDDELFRKVVVTKLKAFCCTLDKKWKTSSRHLPRFIQQNKTWINRKFTIAVPHTSEQEKTPEPQPSTSSSGVGRPIKDFSLSSEKTKRRRIQVLSSSGVGRPIKDFSLSSEKTKRRRIQVLKEVAAPEEIIFAAKTVLRDQGKRAAADIVSQATECSPERPRKIRRSFKKSSKLKQATECSPERPRKIRRSFKKSSKLKGVIPYTEDEALALLIDARMTKNSYHRMRMGAKTMKL
ncbi:hypothetical protein QE152_g7789 [Popillia japonica]|uniref:Uncharacterized protein n=1 Tax=Popillia japonica TaxID=7064 RepID=A0AAW1MDK2_POPJA